MLLSPPILQRLAKYGDVSKTRYYTGVNLGVRTGTPATKGRCLFTGCSVERVDIGLSRKPVPAMR